MARNDEKARYAVAAAVGVVFFVLIGFFAYSTEAGVDGSQPLTYWLSWPIRFGVIWWVALGAIVGAALNFLHSRPLEETRQRDTERPSEADALDGYGEMSDEERRSRISAIIDRPSEASRL